MLEFVTSPLIIAVLPATIAAIAAWFQARATHRAVNSRMDELLALAKMEAEARGRLYEQQDEHVRKGEAAMTTAANAVPSGERS